MRTKPKMASASESYREPVSKLLALGRPEPRSARQPRWPDYNALGLTEDHVAELIQMSTDEALNVAPGDSEAVWAPLHAWRALGQLRATEAIEPLLGLTETYVDDDWLAYELPIVFAMIGADTLPHVHSFLADSSRDLGARLIMTTALRRLGESDASLRERCRTVLRDQLAHHPEQSPDLNGFLISALIDLEARDDIDLIREAFEAGSVDLSVAGDLEDVEVELGVRTHRTTDPPPYFIQAAQTASRQPGRLSDLVSKLYRPTPQPARSAPKVGRNEPCPCGSGRKYKRCCGAR